jgi:mannopine transport system ATP-binding protein
LSAHRASDSVVILESAGAAATIRGAPLSVERVGKRYGEVVAVDSVSLDVRAGEFVSLLGPSGSGKTTLLMMIAGFEFPNAGTIRINARDVTSVPPNRRDVGMVFQKYALFPHLSVLKNVMYPLRMRRIARDEARRRAEAALAMVRLDGYGDRMPHQLSGGQQQRVAVARALVFEPPVLLMDEPLGALDKKLREQMQIEIKRLQQSLGVTVIYVTHDQEEALTMSDRVAVMNGGKLIQIGAPRALYDTPATPFVADFIGKMNFLDGTCRDIAADVIVVELAAGATISVPSACLRGASWPGRGDAVTLAVRPEDIRFGSASPAALPGTIDAAIFSGAQQTFLVRLNDGTTLHAQAPSRRGDATLDTGDTVTLQFEPSALHIFAAGSR